MSFVGDIFFRPVVRHCVMITVVRRDRSAKNRGGRYGSEDSSWRGLGVGGSGGSRRAGGVVW